MARPPRRSGRAVWRRTRENWNKGTAVASAETITLPNDGNVFALTGTTAIKYITTAGWKAGAVVILLFDTTITITDTAGTVPAGTGEILLASNANFSGTASDTLTLVYDGTAWRQVGAVNI